jgi:hypothetical protein
MRGNAGFFQPEFWIPQLQVFVDVIDEREQPFLHGLLILQKVAADKSGLVLRLGH